jgi:preprotein translocase subunit SecD
MEPATRRSRDRRLRLAALALATAAGCSRQAPDLREPELRYTFSIDGDAAAAVPVIEARLRGLPLGGAIRVRGEGGTLVVELPAADGATLERAERLVRQVGSLSIHRVVAGSEYMRRLAQRVERDEEARRLGVTADLDEWLDHQMLRRSDPYLTARDAERPIPVEEARHRGCRVPGGHDPSGTTRCAFSGRESLRQYLREAERIDPRLELAAGWTVVFERVRDAPDDPHAAPAWRTYLIEREAALDSRVIRGARVVVAYDDEPVCEVRFDDAGRAAFASLTRASLGHKIAFLLDGEPLAVPVVMSPIPGGRTHLAPAPPRHGRPGRTDAEDLALLVAHGPLPGPAVLSVVERITRPEGDAVIRGW